MKVAIGQGNEGKIQARRLGSHLKMPNWSQNMTILVRIERALKYLSYDQKLTQTDIKRGSYERLGLIVRFGKSNTLNCKITIEEFQLAFGISNGLKISQF